MVLHIEGPGKRPPSQQNRPFFDGMYPKVDRYYPRVDQQLPLIDHLSTIYRPFVDQYSFGSQQDHRDKGTLERGRRIGGGSGT